MMISIIIPVYKVAATIDRCVRSVVEQEGVSCEIILVDDGSPDECPAMCDRWAERDNRITVIHKENGGLSSARNAGIGRAKGDFLMFVDSDDWLAPGTVAPLEHIMTEHPEYDILEFPVCKVAADGSTGRLDFDNRSYTDMTKYWLEAKAYSHTYAWNKVYRRQLFEDVRFPEGVLFEDVHTLPLLLKKAKMVVTTDKGLYYYCWNNEGITATARAEEWRMLLDAHMKMLPNIDFSTPQGQEYYMHVLNIQIMVSELSDDEPLLPSLRVKVKGNPFPMKAILLNVLGVNVLCRANYLLRKIFKRTLNG